MNWLAFGLSGPDTSTNQHHASSTRRNPLACHHPGRVYPHHWKTTVTCPHACGRVNKQEWPVCSQPLYVPIALLRLPLYTGDATSRPPHAPTSYEQGYEGEGWRGNRGREAHVGPCGSRSQSQAGEAPPVFSAPGAAQSRGSRAAGSIASTGPLYLQAAGVRGNAGGAALRASKGWGRAEEGELK